MTIRMARMVATVAYVVVTWRRGRLGCGERFSALLGVGAGDQDEDGTLGCGRRGHESGP